MIRNYYLLTKPGIIMGNLITTAAGFMLASKGRFDPSLFSLMLLGLGGVIASACVSNNFIDRVSDAKMVRTQNRALARGLITPWKALFFASLLGISGILILTLCTNPIAASIAAAGFVFYVFLYSQLKAHSTHATLVGSIAGAIPPVVGYAAAGAHLDATALLLFLILVFWQMPHFFAIALYRSNDYAAASIPVLPLVRGVHATKVQMLLYTLGFAVANLCLSALYMGNLYIMSTTLLSAAWVWLSYLGFQARDDRLWARSMFRYSLILITLLSALIALDGFYFPQD